MIVTFSEVIGFSTAGLTHGFKPSLTWISTYFDRRFVPAAIGSDTWPSASDWLTIFAPEGRLNLKLYFVFWYRRPVVDPVVDVGVGVGVCVAAGEVVVPVGLDVGVAVEAEVVLVAVGVAVAVPGVVVAVGVVVVATGVVGVVGTGVVGAAVAGVAPAR